MQKSEKASSMYLYGDEGKDNVDERASLSSMNLYVFKKLSM